MKTPVGSIVLTTPVMQRENCFHRKVSCYLILVTLWLSSISSASGQGQVILNGAIVNLNQGAYLVIDNSATNAITRNSGHIISEGENNQVKWNIGTTTGTYVIPWGYGGSNYIPLSFTKTAGTGNGYFIFSTYHTAWNNISQLPAGVTNINGASGLDNSSFVSDRFWQITAQGYTTKPALSNLVFTYLDAENGNPNTITEAMLRAKRYNSTLNSWIDNLLSNSLNTTNNTLTVTSVDDVNLHSWWMLGTLSCNRYWIATSNSTSDISGNWSETSGGTGNAGAPTSGDAIFFDGSANAQCILASDLVVAGLTVTPAFGGTIVQGSNAITVNGPATFSGGTFTGGTAPISVTDNFTISGTAFTAPSSILDIDGNFSLASGSFSHNNGTVSFTGNNGTQTITSASPVTFNNITAANTSVNPGVSVESSQNLKGILTLAENVTFDADGSNNNVIFKLLSTADSPTQDAAVAALPTGAQVSGKVTVQRFMTKEGSNNARIYRYISSPIQNATVADLQQEIHVTGTFTGRNTCSGCTASSQSLFAYDEAVITDTDRNGTANLHDGYVDFPANANTETFQPGKGYALYVRGNLLASTLWDLRGPVNSGNVTPLSFPVSYTTSGILENDGWNLVGNPFPSTIDWNAENGWTKTNLETAIYITDNGSDASLRFASWNGVVGTNGGSRHIAIGQGFWIKANGNGVPVLQATENVKSAGMQTTFFRQAEPSNVLRITVSKGKLQDETVIHFREDATSEFDAHADARKFANSALNISSLLEDGQYLAINSLASLNCSKNIPIAVDNVTPGNYKLDFTEYESFPDDIHIFLKDNFLNSTFNIRNGSYNFSITSAAASFGSSRFEIQFGSIALPAELSVISAAVCEGNDALITIENIQSGISYAAVVDSILIPALHQDGLTTIAIPKSHLVAGENQIKVTASVAYCNTVVEKTVLLNVQPLLTPLATSSVSCGENSVTLTASGAPETGSYNWYEEQTSAYPIESQHSSVFQTPLLKKTKTYYVSAINSLGCEGERIAVKAAIVNLEQVTITKTPQRLSSNYQDGNQWYFNGEKIEGATGAMIEPATSGTYKTEVTQGECTTSTEIEFTVTPQITPPAEKGEAGEGESEEQTGQAEETPEKPATPEVLEESFEGSITVFPNPVLEIALLEIPNSVKSVSKVTVISSTGQIIGLVALGKTGEKQTGSIDLKEYPSGIYFIQIFCADGIHQRKLVKR